MPRERDLSPDDVRVAHICDAIDEALSFVEGKTRDDLAANRMLTLSLIKELEMIGEAAGKISEGFRRKHPEIPWDAMIATRNRLIHGYFDVDVEIVWKTIDEDLPQLSEELSRIRRLRVER